MIQAKMQNAHAQYPRCAIPTRRTTLICAPPAAFRPRDAEAPNGGDARRAQHRTAVTARDTAKTATETTDRRFGAAELVASPPVVCARSASSGFVADYSWTIRKRGGRAPQENLRGTNRAARSLGAVSGCSPGRRRAWSSLSP